MKPYDDFGLPYHAHEENDLIKLSEKKSKSFEMDLLPVSNVFNEGNKVQLVINFADRDNADNLVYDSSVSYTLEKAILKLPVKFFLSFRVKTKLSYAQKLS